MDKQQNRQSLGQQIREVREEQGWSVEQLALLCDVKGKTIESIEEGRFNVPLDIIGRVCDALGVKLTLQEV